MPWSSYRYMLRLAAPVAGPAKTLRKRTSNGLFFRVRLLIGIVLFTTLSHHSTVTAKSGDRKKAINVKAESSEYDERAGTQTLSGDVEITQGSMSIRADSITIELRDGALFRISGLGSPIRFQQLTESNELMRGQSNEIIYKIPSSEITFRGDAEFERPGQKFSGHSIEYSMQELTFKAKGKKTDKGNGRVNIILQPGKIKQ